MPTSLQARLLRVLAEREVLPIGAVRPIPVNIRVIAATHFDLAAMVREGRFRDDLFYRLNGAHLVLPPLRERRDLAWLVHKMLAPIAGTEDEDPNAAKASLRITPEVEERLGAHTWPGNLRELRNVIEFARAVCTEGTIDVGDLPDTLQPGEADLHTTSNQRAAIDPDDTALLIQYLRAAQWNVTAVARQLGVSRMTLYRRMKRGGIESPNRQSSRGERR
jgi:transcriptional regulator of acetoin/glycerol metabolism